LTDTFIANNSKYAEIIGEIISHTQYFTLSQVTIMLRRSIERWLSTRSPKPLYVCHTSLKLGSEDYFYNLFKHLLPKHRCITERSDSPVGEYEIVCIDDWCLSGVNMISALDNLFYQNQKLATTDLEITCILAIATEGCSSLLKNLSTEWRDTYPVNVFYDTLIEPYEVKATPSLHQEFLEIFMPDTLSWAYAVHLEYKIANQFGSYETIYSQCRPTVVKPYSSKTILPEMRSNDCWPLEI
jgi:hypothetical protein